MIVLVFHMETLSHAAAGGDAAVEPPPPLPGSAREHLCLSSPAGQMPSQPLTLQPALRSAHNPEAQASWKAIGFIDRSCREP